MSSSPAASSYNMDADCLHRGSGVYSVAGAGSGGGYGGAGAGASGYGHGEMHGGGVCVSVCM